MASLCYSCRRRTATIHCLTENASFCLTCDYFLHSQANITNHIRNPLCDDCSYNPAIFVCNNHRTYLCQPCYSDGYNCANYGHRLGVLNHVVQQTQFHSNNNQHHHDGRHVYVPQQQQQHHGPPREPNNNHVGGQRSEGLFATRCNGNNNCERWMFALKCDSCLASNAMVYCQLDDLFLCNHCDLIIHQLQTVLPHMRSVLCVTCKRVSRNFLVGANQFNLPTTPPLPAVSEEVAVTATPPPPAVSEEVAVTATPPPPAVHEEVAVTTPSGPNQQDNN